MMLCRRRRMYKTCFSPKVVVICCTLMVYSAMLYRCNINITPPAYWRKESSNSTNPKCSTITDTNNIIVNSLNEDERSTYKGIISETKNKPGSPSEQSLGPNTATFSNVKNMIMKDLSPTKAKLTSSKTYKKKSTLVPTTFTSDQLHEQTVHELSTAKYNANDKQDYKPKTTELHSTMAASIANLFTTSYIVTPVKNSQVVKRNLQDVTKVKAFITHYQKGFQLNRKAKYSTSTANTYNYTKTPFISHIRNITIKTDLNTTTVTKAHIVSIQEMNTTTQNFKVSTVSMYPKPALLSTVKALEKRLKYSTTTEPSYIKIDTAGFITKLNSSLQLLQPQQQTNLSVCSPYYGGLGNQMFQFAASFGVAASKNMSLIIPKSHEVVKFFDIDQDFLFDDDACENFTERHDSLPCSFDPKLGNFDGKSNYKIGTYLQSWMYFFESANALRNQFVFKEHIRNQTQDITESLLLKHNFTSRHNVTLVGVHIRRGNMVNHTLGYMVATEEYLQKAMRHFTSKYVSNIIFLVCSDDMEWSKENIPDNHTVEFISGHKPEIDMSILGSCDHLISTVGSFSWWSAWLTGGEVTYFKWPAAEGSTLRSLYSEEYSDYFYPGWIGI